MRTNFTLRKARPVHVGAGVAMLAIPATAVALTAGQANAQSAIQITLKPRNVAFGRDVVVTGNATAAAAGASLELEFAPSGTAQWRAVRSTRARADGSFRFVQALRHSGLLKVAPAGTATSSAGTATSSSPLPRVSPSASSASVPVSASATRPVSVAAHFWVSADSLAVTGGQRAHLRGKLLPAVSGRRVRLLGRIAHGWQTLASARTGPRGGFDLPVSANGSGQRWLRVAFAGDPSNAGTWAHAGSVTAFRQSLASWYDDGGTTACGFHAFYGVANKSLPCGAQVTFRLGGRSVNAVVDDRGPYVGDREWDLNQNTAAALGFGGVGVVWSSI